jgi:protein-disulfide isomerase
MSDEHRVNGHRAAGRKLRVTDADHARGPTDAGILVIEYGDFTCAPCKLAHPAVRLLLQQFVPQIRFVYRHFLLGDGHPLAVPAAEAAECAAAQGRFWEMHDLLFDNQPWLHRQHLDEYARRLRLDRSRFAAELDGHAHLGKVRADLESGFTSHVRRTPGFFVNGSFVDVSHGMRSLFDAVDAALQES